MKNAFNSVVASAVLAVTATTATLGVASAIFPSAAVAATTSASGQFRGADSSHPASGGARVIRLKGGGFGIKLESNFKTRGGPDLRVWLSEAKNPRSGRAVRAADHVDLGRLKSSSGEQIYRLPAGTSLAEAQSVVIWCRAFGVFFASAALS
ncbi:DM13 domain-containing protein [Qipengyuania sp. DSG2-2]|uniref:DM13 domain-containing protein n=1 Tax=Qipengyuania sp. DGS2-2 TaxID=3349631 RepID=UPI0036D3C8AC